jgi:adenylosuccinate lyase
MIKRYTRQQMADIWSESRRYDHWLEIEVLTCEARAKLNLMPADAADRIRKKASYNIDRIAHAEEHTKHDMIAFVTVVEDSLGKDASYFHEGLTSSDILDTCLALQIRDAAILIRENLINLVQVTRKLAIEHKNTVCIGRTHGIHAEPTTFGLKCAVWYQDFKRAVERINAAIKEISVGKLSGAVGTFAHLPLAVEDYVMQELGLEPEPVATQVVQRDRHASFLCVLALAASVAEKIAVEIRHCQRTEVLELEESFAKGQRGSSAMPHKKNPILCENITGLARLVKGYVTQALENIALWHERDISHSSVERVIFPDATTALDFLLVRLHEVLSGLIVNKKQMSDNINILNGLVFSQKILLALTGKGVTRNDAYELVQRNALKTWKERSSFHRNLLADSEISEILSESELADLFDVSSYLVNIDAIYKRIGLIEA